MILTRAFPTAENCMHIQSCHSFMLVTPVCDSSLQLYGMAVQTRARIWLFFSYLVAFGSVAGAVAVLITCVQHQENIAIGVVSGEALCLLCSSIGMLDTPRDCNSQPSISVTLPYVITCVDCGSGHGMLHSFQHPSVVLSPTKPAESHGFRHASIFTRCVICCRAPYFNVASFSCQACYCGASELSRMSLTAIKAYYSMCMGGLLQKQHLFVALVLPSPESHICSGALSMGSSRIHDISCVDLWH